MAPISAFNDLVVKYRYTATVEAGLRFLTSFMKQHGDINITPGMLLEEWVLQGFDPEGKKLVIDPAVIFTGSDRKEIPPVSALLDFYSLLEIAFSANYIARILGGIEDEIVTILNYGPVKTYCFEAYRSVLPLQLLDRLRQVGTLQNQYNPQISFPLFLKFLNLTDFLKESSEINTLINAEEGELTHFFTSFGDEGVKSELLFEFEDGEIMEGYQYYLEFLQMFDGLMLESENIPELQSAFVQYLFRWIDIDQFPVGLIFEQSKSLFRYMEENFSTVTVIDDEQFDSKRLETLILRINDYVSRYAKVYAG
jgi:hypothetical protein